LLLVVTSAGHTVAAVLQSFHLAKDCGFKIISHMMPDLPNMGFERDLEQFRVRFFLLLVHSLMPAYVEHVWMYVRKHLCVCIKVSFNILYGRV
jgi:hypothetical protein